MASQLPVPITAPPKADQLVEHNGKSYRTIREGLAYILVPPNARTSQDPQAKTKAANGDSNEQPQNVFYNPIQQFNRDLSVLAIRAFGEDLCERRRAKWQKSRGKQAGKKERKKDRKRKRGDDGMMTEPAKAQKHVEEVVQDGGHTLTDAGPLMSDDLDTIEQKSIEDTAQQIPDHVAEAEKVTESSKEADAVNVVAPVDDAPDPEAHWQPQFRILDALSATGLRALRYAKEIPFATYITANDMDRKAVQSIDLHIQHNEVASKVHPSTANALAHMYGVAHPPLHSHGPSHISGKYDVIDLDPYGTAAPFIDAALQALNDGGLLCVTCTDSGVFASCGYAEKTFSLYGGMPVKGNHSHEAGLRLILHSIATTAARHGISIEPLLSLSIDFYARTFVRIRRSPAEVKFLAGKTMVVYNCDSGCGAWTTQMLGRNTRQTGKGDHINWKYTIAQAPNSDRLCEHCGSKTHVAGPMWAGPLHHPAFIEKILDDVRQVDKDVYATTARVEGMLDTALEELFKIEYADESSASDEIIPKLAPELLDRQPFFFLPSALAKVVHCVAPPEAAIKGALRHAGYRATRSHCKPGSVKTDAPWTAIWDIMREWVKQKAPIKEGKIKERTPGWKIMQLGREQAPQHDQADGIEARVVEEVDPSKQPDTNGTGAPNDSVAQVKKMKVVFDEALGRDRPGKKLVRYQSNPRENWGPMARAR